MELSMETAVEIWQDGVLAPGTVSIIRETALHISVNGNFLVRLACSGNYLEYLTMGFLHSAGLIDAADDVRLLEIRQEGDQFFAEAELTSGVTLPQTTVTSGQGRSVALPGQQLAALTRPAKPLWALEAIMAFAAELERRSGVYHLTHGCHNSALANEHGIVLQREDIGRHNAIDMLTGQCLMEGRNTSCLMIVSSGRIASEMVQKAIRAGFPVYASFSSATSHAVERARELGLTLVGNVHPGGLRIYHDNGRLIRP